MVNASNLIPTKEPKEPKRECQRGRRTREEEDGDEEDDERGNMANVQRARDRGIQWQKDEKEPKKEEIQERGTLRGGSIKSYVTRNSILEEAMEKIQRE